MNDLPLVSVCVVTFNSSEYILETLESVKAQTYQNIELIVADDKSTDSTNIIVSKWIKDNKERFCDTKLIIPESNSGTAGNYNRGIKQASGKWIKFIDGDDLLLPSCIMDNIKYVNENPNAKIVFSNVIYFDNGKKIDFDNVYFNDELKNLFNLSPQQILCKILYENIIPSTPFFVENQLISSNLYNERYVVLEDFPKWVDLLNKGYQFHYFDKVTVCYRCCESVSNSQERFFSNLYFQSEQCFFWNEAIFYIKKYNLREAYNKRRIDFFINEIAEILFHNKKTALSEFCMKKISSILRRFTLFYLS